MTAGTTETSPLVLARVAGILYLLLVPLGIFGILYVPDALIVDGDAGLKERIKELPAAYVDDKWEQEHFR